MQRKHGGRGHNAHEGHGVKVYGPSIPWTLLFLGILFGAIALPIYGTMQGEMQMEVMFFLLSLAFVGFFIYVFFGARFYYLTDRGISVKVLGAWKIASYPWEMLQGTRGQVMRGRYSGVTNASARITRVYTHNGRIAFKFSFLTANFGALHQDIFLHIREANREQKEE